MAGQECPLHILKPTTPTFDLSKCNYDPRKESCSVSCHPKFIKPEPSTLATSMVETLTDNLLAQISRQAGVYAKDNFLDELHVTTCMHIGALIALQDTIKNELQTFYLTQNKELEKDKEVT